MLELWSLWGARQLGRGVQLANACPTLRGATSVAFSSLIVSCFLAAFSVGCGDPNVEVMGPELRFDVVTGYQGPPPGSGGNVVLGGYSSSGAGGADVTAYDGGTVDSSGPSPSPPSPPQPGPKPGGACDPPDPATMTPCCDNGEAYCRPGDIVSADLAGQLASCDGGGVCVPAAYMGSGYNPKACTSIAGAEGACVSVCVEKVKLLQNLLPQDICAGNERCAPCVDPTDGTDSGACNAVVCEEATQGPGQPGDDVDEPPADPCVNPPQLIDPALFPVCCPGSHCVPAALVPADQKALLDTCGDKGEGYCVPAAIIATGGKFTPTPCTSVGGSEGRCMSTCIPQVAEQANDLPTDICAAGEKCTPCCEPFTGQSTGACTQECDPGPADPICKVLFTPCCDSIEGHCIAPEQVPDDKEGNLEKCDNGFLCVPDVMQDLSFKGAPCYGNILFGGDYFGVCLPDCLKLPFEFGLDKNGCPGGWVCAPCQDPFFGAPTGAPGC